MTYFVVPVMLAVVLQSAPQSRVTSERRQAPDGARTPGGARSRGILVRRDRWPRRREHAAGDRGVSQGARKRARARRAAAPEIPHHVARYRRTVRRADTLRPHRAIEAPGACRTARSSKHSPSAFTPRLRYSRALNSSAAFDADSVVLVPNVEPLVIPAQTSNPEAQSARPEATGTSGRASASGLGSCQEAESPSE